MNGWVMLASVVVVVCGVHGQGDSLDCTPEEVAAAKSSVSTGLQDLYLPLLDESSGNIRTVMTNENDVTQHIDCIIENKACTKLGKSLQYFITNQSGTDLCAGCQPCQRTRFQFILTELRCKYPAQANRIQTFVTETRKIDIYQYFSVDPTC
ncbi:uncharacterized protein [Procambarus clarkii]|uniref:uncharacterized protein n=1 Tax=Procambarus clarkii TaxID=6728 RepID=UPI001E6728BD|nr:uncharacterized protein LOC123768176 [Procambarus clarkii]